MTQPFGQETPADVRAERDALRAEVERLRAAMRCAREFLLHGVVHHDESRAVLKRIDEALGDD